MKECEKMDKTIYFDNAATTMNKPNEVAKAVYNAILSCGNSGRGAYKEVICANETIAYGRIAVANFFDVEKPNQVVFTNNATESLNIAIKGLLEENDHVITTVLEHNSVLRPLYSFGEKIEMTIIPCDKKGNIDYFLLESSIKSNTKMIVCTHGSNVLGTLLDIEKIGQICRKYNLLFVLDASQTAGSVPISMKKLNIDVLCFTGHKGLFGPQGIGGLCVREGLMIRSLKEGGTGVQSVLKEQPKEMPEHLEAGTLNTPGIAGLLAGIQYINNVGLEQIREKEKKLWKQFYNEISTIDSVICYGDYESDNRLPIVSFNINGMDSSYVSDILSETYNIASRSGMHCAPLVHKAMKTENLGMVRFSFSYRNTEEEVNYGINAIRELATNKNKYI